MQLDLEEVYNYLDFVLPSSRWLEVYEDDHNGRFVFFKYPESINEIESVMVDVKPKGYVLNQQEEFIYSQHLRNGRKVYKVKSLKEFEQVLKQEDLIYQKPYLICKDGQFVDLPKKIKPVKFNNVSRPDNRS